MIATATGMKQQRNCASLADWTCPRFPGPGSRQHSTTGRNRLVPRPRASSLGSTSAIRGIRVRQEYDEAGVSRSVIMYAGCCGESRNDGGKRWNG